MILMRMRNPGSRLQLRSAKLRHCRARERLGCLEWRCSAGGMTSDANIDKKDNKRCILMILPLAAIFVVPDPALAITEVVAAEPGGAFEIILRTTEALGPWGGLFFVLAVAVCECIPLFPTTPLSLSSGMLFGAQKGALCVLGGTFLASMIAFGVARSVARPMAEKMLLMESSDEEDSSVLEKQIHNIENVIEKGSSLQQTLAVLVLRLTPVIPFSVSNYVLGLSPLPLAPYAAGTLVGMCFWSFVYASLGSASRSILSKGMDSDVILGQLVDIAGCISGRAVVAILIGLVGAGMLFAASKALPASTRGSSSLESNAINTWHAGRPAGLDDETVSGPQQTGIFEGMKEMMKKP